MYKCLRIPSNDVLIRSGYRDIRIYFLIIIPIFIQQVAIQLQILACDSQVKAEILSGKDAFKT